VTNTDLKRSAYLPFAALVLLALIWDYNWVVMKVGVRYSDPFTFAALRNFLGAIALFAVVPRGALAAPQALLAHGPLRPLPDQPIRTKPYGAVHRERRRTSILTYTMPFWLLFIAWPVLGERIRGVQWVAVLLGLGGLVFVVDPWSLRGVWASLLAMGGGLAWAIASALFKIIRKRHEVDVLSFTAWQGLLGSIPLIVVALLVDHKGRPGTRASSRLSPTT